MEALLLVVTAVQRYHSFVVGGHAGIEQTSVIVEGTITFSARAPRADGD